MSNLSSYQKTAASGKTPSGNPTGFNKSKSGPKQDKTGFLRRHWASAASLLVVAFYLGEAYYHTEKAEHFVDHQNMFSHAASEVQYDIGDVIHCYKDAAGRVTRMFSDEPAPSDLYTASSPISEDSRMKIVFHTPVLYDDDQNIAPPDAQTQRFYDYQKEYILDQVELKGTPIGQRIAHEQYLDIFLATEYDTLNNLNPKRERRLEYTKDPERRTALMALYAVRDQLTVEASRDYRNQGVTAYPSHYNSTITYLEPPAP